MVRQVFSAGGIVYKTEGDKPKFLLVRNHSLKDPSIDYWGFPKGHLEVGEDPESAARREVLEETGIEAKIVEKIGESRYIYYSVRFNERVAKTVTIFLMKDVRGVLKRQEIEILELGWFDFAEAVETLSFPNDKDFLKKAKGVLEDTKK